MYQQNNEEERSVGDIYDSYILSGYFDESSSIPEEHLHKIETSLENAIHEQSDKKGKEKLFSQIKILEFYAELLSLKDGCIVESKDNTGKPDKEGLFCFICVRHPELDLDWRTLQKVIATSKTQVIEYHEEKTLELAITIYISAIKNILNK